MGQMTHFASRLSIDEWLLLVRDQSAGRERIVPACESVAVCEQPGSPSPAAFCQLHGELL